MPQPPDDGDTRPTGEHPHPEPSTADQHTPASDADPDTDTGPDTDVVDRTPDGEPAPPAADDPPGRMADPAALDEARTGGPAEEGPDAEDAPPTVPADQAPTEHLRVVHEEPAHQPGDLPFLPTQLVTPTPGTDHPADWQTTAPAESQRRMWVTIVLVLAVLLCGGGGVSAYLLLRNAESTDGAPDPSTAVNRFLTAVYTDQNADRAAELVCRESRDVEKLGRKVDEVRSAATTYTGPKFTWSTPTVAREREEHAVVNVKLTMTTRDEKIADQQLTFTTVRKTGWWVCEVSG